MIPLYIHHDSRVRENSEVVITYPDMIWYIYIIILYIYIYIYFPICWLSPPSPTWTAGLKYIEECISPIPLAPCLIYTKVWTNPWFPVWTWSKNVFFVRSFWACSIEGSSWSIPLRPRVFLEGLTHFRSRAGERLSRLVIGDSQLTDYENSQFRVV